MATISRDTQPPRVILPPCNLFIVRNFLRETKFLFFEIVYHGLISTVLLLSYRGGEVEEGKEKLDLRAEIPIADFIKTRERTWAVLIKRGVAYPCFSIQDRMELKRKLHCKPFSWYLKNVYPELVIPTSEGGPGGSLKQGSTCLDSMGHLLDGNVGLYPCHDIGGNQVSIGSALFMLRPSVYSSILRWNNTILYHVSIIDRYVQFLYFNYRGWIKESRNFEKDIEDS